MKPPYDGNLLQNSPYLQRNVCQLRKAEDVSVTQLSVDFVLRDIRDNPIDDPRLRYGSPQRELWLLCYLATVAPF
jgi:hypothetical protein